MMPYFCDKDFIYSDRFRPKEIFLARKHFIHSHLHRCIPCLYCSNQRIGTLIMHPCRGSDADWYQTVCSDPIKSKCPFVQNHLRKLYQLNFPYYYVIVGALLLFNDAPLKQQIVWNIFLKQKMNSYIQWIPEEVWELILVFNENDIQTREDLLKAIESHYRSNICE